MDWENVDNQLNKYLNTYKRKQNVLKDDIQNIFNIKYALNDTINNSDLKRFKRYIEDREEYIKENNYVSYMATKYSKKSRLSYKDMIKIMLLVAYATFEYNLHDSQIDTLTKINENAMNEAIGKCEKLGLVPKHKMPLLDALLFTYLMTPNNMGVSYQEQNDANAIYGAEEIYKQAIIDISQEKEPNVDDKRYVEIFLKQQKREINKKKLPQKDKFSGYIDNENTFLLNQVMVEVYKSYGVEMVIFRGMMDEKSTEMCKSLEGQKFYIDKMNVYDRYSKEDGKNVIYHSQGLVLGENLPPIGNNFHWCRSWLDPYIEV